MLCSKMEYFYWITVHKEAFLKFTRLQFKIGNIFNSDTITSVASSNQLHYLLYFDNDEACC